jgi:hypothetical protein
VFSVLSELPQPLASSSAAAAAAVAERVILMAGLTAES